MIDVKNDKIECPMFIRFVKTKPCLICGSSPTDPDHLKARGMGSGKQNDMFAVPICRQHHSERHQIGTTDFEKKYRINLWEESAKLIVEFVTFDIDKIPGIFGPRIRAKANPKQIKVVLDPTTGCHRWAHSNYSNRYPVAIIDGVPKRLSRYVLEQKLGRPILPGMFALHTCDNRACINGDHLYEGDKKQNAKDMVQRRRHVLPDNRGSKSYAAKLSDGAIIAARSRYLRGESITKIAIEYGVADTTLGRALLGRTWKHLPNSEKVRDGQE